MPHADFVRVYAMLAGKSWAANAGISLADCKTAPPADAGMRKACEALLKEFLPKLKALPNAEVTRVVCGQCGDFKVIVNQPCADHDAWAGAEYNPLEAEFMAALKKIEGTLRHEAQEFTMEAL